jgi:hypothetical protein
VQILRSLDIIQWCNYRVAWVPNAKAQDWWGSPAYELKTLKIYISAILII